MIHVIASIQVKKGRVSEFLEIFKSNMPAVLKEKGCIEYVPAVDVLTDLPPQEKDDHVVTVIEKWNSLEDLTAHMSAPHMLAYREKTRALVERTSVRILTQA
ncbi:MAG: putative quinol monooxygenase [Desulfotignum sp.]|nr:putative quinol monooxygenase [Desulfotignum sp.]